MTPERRLHYAKRITRSFNQHECHDTCYTCQTDQAEVTAILDEALKEMAQEMIESQEFPLREALRFVRQTVHQAHHEGAIENCLKNTCGTAAIALGEKVKMPWETA